MIDLAQWRAVIGQWVPSCRTKVRVSSDQYSRGRRKEVSFRHTAVSILICVSLLLLQSGDVELNPGPETDVKAVKNTLKEVFITNYSSLFDALKDCLKGVSVKMYSKHLISVTLRDSPTFDGICREFEAGIKLKEHIDQLERHCQLFLTCIASEGGPAEEVAKKLAKEWKEEVLKHHQTVLSFQMHSGESVDSDIEISQISDIQVTELMQFLEKLIRWNDFKSFLSIGISENRSVSEFGERASCSRWLSIYPRTSWKDVIDALEKAEMKSLAEKVRQQFTEVTPKGVNDLPVTSMVVEKTTVQTVVSHSSQIPLDEPVAVSSMPSSNASVITGTSSSQSKTVPKLVVTEEIKIKETLESLDYSFKKLMNQLKKEVKQMGDEDLDDMKSTACEHLEEKSKEINDSKTGNELLETLKPHYDFLDCSIIIDIVETCISSETLSELKKHLEAAEMFRDTEPVLKLRDDLHKLYNPEKDADLADAPRAVVGLQSSWNLVPIKRLYALMKCFFHGIDQKSLTRHIIVTKGSIVIQYFMTESPAEIDQIIAAAQSDIPFMKFIGIYGMTINGQIILTEDENMNFTFELSFLEAARAGHNEAVEFLLQLVTDINYQNEDGTTALMVAAESGHERVVNTLLSAPGVDVNLQDNYGRTAIMRASDHDHTNIIHSLLEANANPRHLKRADVSNALMTVSFRGRFATVQRKGDDYQYQREDGLTALLSACQNGHIQVVELLLKEQVDPNVHDQDGWTALMFACQNGHIQVVELLLQEQADPNVQTEEGWTALMFACQSGHIQIVELLLKEQADPNVQENDCWTALMFACQNSHVQVVELLLKKQADLNLPNKNGWTALMLACQNGHIQVVELLLKEQADPNVQNKDGNTALTLACLDDHTQVIDLLLKEQADPNVQIKSTVIPFLTGMTALIYAVFFDHLEIVQMLLKAKANPNVQQSDGMTALMFASGTGNLEVVRLLLKGTCNADPNLQQSNGMTALAHAVIRGHPTVVHELIAAGANTNQIVTIDIKGCLLEYTLLQFSISPLAMRNSAVKEMSSEVFEHAEEALREQLGAMILKEIIPSSKPTTDKAYLQDIIYQSVSGIKLENHIEVIKLLLQAEANPDDDPFLLVIASGFGYTQVVQMLLQAGYNPDTPLSSSKLYQSFCKISLGLEDKPGFSGTGLMVACAVGHVEVVQLLLEANSNPNLQEKTTGATALMIAVECGHTDIVEKLLHHGADPNICDNEGSNVIHYAVNKVDEAGQQNIIELLLTRNVSVDLQDVNGHTPLMIASWKGYVDATFSLLEKANPNIIDKEGMTALMHACINEHCEIVQLLMAFNADPQPVDNSGLSALLYAALTGHIEIVNSLLNNYVPDQQEMEKGLVLACYGGNESLAHLFMDKVDLTTDERLLLEACMNDDVAYVASTILECPDTPLVGASGLTPLMVALSFGNTDTVDMLIQAGADVNKLDNYFKNSPLFYAISGSKSVHLVKYLLEEAGANVNVIANEQTPLDVANAMKLDEISELLVSYRGETYSSLQETTTFSSSKGTTASKEMDTFSSSNKTSVHYHQVPSAGALILYVIANLASCSSTAMQSIMTQQQTSFLPDPTFTSLRLAVPVF